MLKISKREKRKSLTKAKYQIFYQLLPIFMAKIRSLIKLEEMLPEKIKYINI